MQDRIEKLEEKQFQVSRTGKHAKGDKGPRNAEEEPWWMIMTVEGHEMGDEYQDMSGVER